MQNTRPDAESAPGITQDQVDDLYALILTAQGESAENPPTNWYRHVRNTVAMVNDSAELFLGLRLSCANCHNHPYERITQDDYWDIRNSLITEGKARAMEKFIGCQSGVQVMT